MKCTANERNLLLLLITYNMILLMFHFKMSFSLSEQLYGTHTYGTDSRLIILYKKFCGLMKQRL